jgi:lipoprotein-releasing system permease protein
LTWNLPAISSVVERLLGIQFLPPNVYPIDKLPAYIDPQSIGIIVVVAMFVSFLATLYPAWNASKLDPVVALRYE